MAYNFIASSSQCLSTSSIPVTTPPFTISTWFRRGSIAGNPSVVGFFQNASNGTAQLLTLRSDTKLAAGSYNSATYDQSLSAATTTLNVWTHGAGVWASTSSRTVYVNGTAGTTNTTNISVANLNSIGIGATIRPTLSDQYNGDIADVGIWNISLTADEIISLSRGVSCLLIRPQNLIFFAPLIRSLQDVTRGLTITNRNSATVSNHPRIYI